MTSPDDDLFELGALKLESRVTLPCAKLAYKTYGTLSPAKDNVIIFPCAYNGLPARGERGAHRQRISARSVEVFHHRLRSLRQQPVIFAEQHASPFGWPPLSGGYHHRQCPRPAPTGDREIRRRKDQTGYRILDGRAPGIPSGSALPPDGRTDRANLRRRTLLSAQLRVPSKPQGDARSRPSVQ
jgi:hypothetical protein